MRAVEEGLDQHLVGGVQHRRRAAARAQRLVGQRQAGKALEVGRDELQAGRP